MFFALSSTPFMERASSQSPHGHYVPLLKIVLAWVSALALASGHHTFYTSLDNHSVTARWAVNVVLKVKLCFFKW
jgi:hypothetical protein